MKNISRKYIAEKVIKIIKQQFENNLNVSVFEYSNLAEMDADSLDRMNIAISLEEEFSIDIKNEDTEQWTTVKDVIDYIERRIL